MSVCKLLEAFQSIDIVPMPVSRIVEALRDLGVTDEIRYAYDLELDPKVMLGFLHRVESRRGRKRYISTITYAKVGHELERLVVTKELIHVVDPVEVRISDRDGVKHLIERIVLPPELSYSADDSEEVKNDRYAIYEAIALLFPLAARNRIYADYMANRITLAKIADQAELPMAYVAPVMTGHWPAIVTALIEKRRRMEAALATPQKPRKARLLRG